MQCYQEQPCQTQVRIAHPSDLKYVEQLQKKFSNQVGFVPRAALEWYLQNRHVLLALENDQPAGYVLGRPSLRYDRRIKPITQTAVQLDAQRRHLGEALIEELVGDAMFNGQVMLQAWCANDIAAREFWPAVGFQAVASREPGTARARTLTLWRRHLATVEPFGFRTVPPVAGWKAGRVRALAP